jgi:acetyltransferase
MEVEIRQAGVYIDTPSYPEEVRLRFFVPMKTLSRIAAMRFTQPDYNREMRLILTEPGIPGRSEIFGAGNIIAEPDNERAGYATIVRHDVTAMGLGIFLLKRIIDCACDRGIRELYGDVLHENHQSTRETA